MLAISATSDPKLDRREGLAGNEANIPLKSYIGLLTSTCTYYTSLIPRLSPPPVLDSLTALDSGKAST